MSRRDDQIAALRENTNDLDPTRLEEFYRLTRESYERTSIVPSVARINFVEDREPSGFRVFANQELRRIEHFNGPEYHWDTYCAELGRSVAFAEEGYLYGVLDTDIVRTDVVDHRSALRLAIQRAVIELHSECVLVAPVSYMTNLLGVDDFPLTWDTAGKPMIDTHIGAPIPIFWNRNSTTDRFFLVSPQAGMWNVKADPWTETRLTVAIGIQRTPIRGVTFLAQTVVKYEIKTPTGIRAFKLSEPPDDTYLRN